MRKTIQNSVEEHEQWPRVGKWAWEVQGTGRYRQGEERGSEKEVVEGVRERRWLSDAGGGAYEGEGWR